MKNLIVLGAALFVAATASAAFVDDFESYADQAAFEASWIPFDVNFKPPMDLDQTKGYNSDQSVHGICPTNWTTGYRNYCNLDQEYAGSDAAPLEFSVMVDVDVVHYLTRSWIEIRGYDGGTGYGEGAWEEIIALGFTSALTGSKYHARVVGGDGWFNIDDGSLNPALDRTTEWTKLTARIKTSTVEFYVNDTLGYTSPRAPGVTFDCVILGSGYTSTYDAWFDDVSVQIIPEPGALVLLALGGLALLRRR